MNISFEYLYRDGANYKNWGQIIVEATPGLTLPELESQIREALIDGEHFVAEEVKIPTLYFTDRDIGIDHWWHEYSGLSWTEESPTSPGSIKDLIVRLETAKKWDGIRRV